MKTDLGMLDLLKRGLPETPLGPYVHDPLQPLLTACRVYECQRLPTVYIFRYCVSSLLLLFINFYLFFIVTSCEPFVKKDNMN